MNINTFENVVSAKMLKRGKDYFNRGRVTECKLESDGFVEASVQGSEEYFVEMNIDSDGNVIYHECDCPYEGRVCKHVTAVMYELRKMINMGEEKNTKKQTAPSKKKSSVEVSRLIYHYEKDAQTEVDMANEEEGSIIITPILTNTLYYGLTLSLKISRRGGREYIIKNIIDTYDDFRERRYISYGKELKFRHSVDLLDERSLNLLELAVNEIRRPHMYSSYSNREIKLGDRGFVDLMRMYDGDYIRYNAQNVYVSFSDPEAALKITKQNNGYELMIDAEPTAICTVNRLCMFSQEKSIIYIASKNMSKAVCGLYRILDPKKSIFISDEDMQYFYNMVLKPASRYMTIIGAELLEEIIPPEAEIKLYIDAADNDEVKASLVFSYGDKSFVYPYEPETNPCRDYMAEAEAENAVSKYFYTDEKDEFYNDEEDEIYSLLTEGISELSKIMDVYVTDRLKRMNVRPPARPVVGIRAESKLLSIDITAEGYSQEELIEMLGAYRRGKKYHRLKDGSFASIGSGLAELAELTQNLNIDDRDLMNNDLSVPRYRMLYLDSIQSDADGMRISRSKNFKSAIRDYKSLIDDSQWAAVPDELDNIMRDYQKYGFRWMKTIAAYGFGGILADDMGLGKTLQAIALILDMKENGGVKAMVVCPSSLTLNWESEIRKFAPELKTSVVTGTAAVREEKLKNIDDYEVIITSYQTLVRDIAKYKKASFDLQFVDEAQYIKNQGTQMAKAAKGVNSKIRFALTGTPVENSLAELWSIFDFVMPGYLFKYTYFKKIYEKPVVREGNEDAVKALQRLVSPFLLRRMKKEVLTELPDKTETILRAELDDEQSKVYSANVAEVKQSMSIIGGNGKEKIKILAMLTRLRQLCCDPSLVYENYSGGSAKLEMCMELVETCVESGHKLLLFSQFTSMLDIINKRLGEMGISTYVLTGATKPKDRLRMVNSFNSNEVNVFLISLKAGGTGLNLTGADIVIHYDPWWNVSAENQASDRVYRIGQTRNVQIYKLIAGKTIEERIIELQERKAELSDIAVNGDGDIMKMSAEDIMSLLE
ncbi:MAG: SNF2 helicase associated domain-containing protein [bacterium]|nr:SNF2 helicase associated domain-containing protein [bacterium]